MARFGPRSPIFYWGNLQLSFADASLLNMKKIWWTFKLIGYFIRISISPTDTTAALGMGECLYDLGFVKEMSASLVANKECAQVILERKLMNRFDLLALQKLAPGTLGRCYADHMLSLGLNPDFFKPMLVTNDSSFSMLRLRQTHDLWHVLLGFDTSVPGEIGLQSFYFAQLRAPIAPFLVGGSLLGASFRRRETLLPIFESIIKGWHMGLKAKSIYPFDWEAHWETPLKDLRASLDVVIS